LPTLWPGVVLVLLALASWWPGDGVSPPVLNLALLGAATLALVQLAAMRSIDPIYDIKPMAQAIRQVQKQGLPVANAARYHAQYQFLGRLKRRWSNCEGPN